MGKLLLTLICSPALEQTIIDWLLTQDSMPGFTSLCVYGHGSDPHTLSLVERVEGRKKKIMFQVHLEEQHARQIVNKLKQEFGGTKIHYWLQPLVEAGKLVSD